MNKHEIDNEAEREGQALKRQGRCFNTEYRRKRQAINHNQAEFDKLWRESHGFKNEGLSSVRPIPLQTRGIVKLNE